MSSFPQRIVCLTEESVEVIFRLGAGNRIVGVSQFVERPPEAKCLPVVSSFIKADIEKIKLLNPDLILGYSDVQQNMAKELIAEGMNVFIANHRSLANIIDYTLLLARILGKNDQGEELVRLYQKKIDEAKQFKNIHPARRIYLEEWDAPHIVASLWWSEIFHLLGAENIFSFLSSNSKSMERQIEWAQVIERDPEVMAFCLCGKKANFDQINRRDKIKETQAYKNQRMFELDSTIFLQPGPAVILEGIDLAKKILSN